MHMRSLMASLLAVMLPALASAQAGYEPSRTYQPSSTIFDSLTITSGAFTCGSGTCTLNGSAILAFGGTTSSFPALKQSSARLQVRLADDSGLAGLDMGGSSTFGVGTGSATAKLTGVLHVNVTSQATVGTTEEILATYTLPANTLSSNGKLLRIVVEASCTANTNVKQLRVRFGGITGAQLTNVSVSTATHDTILLTAYVMRVSGNSQRSWSVTNYGESGAATAGVSFPRRTSSSITDTATIDIVVTGQTPSAVGELTFRTLIVEAINN